MFSPYVPLFAKISAFVLPSLNICVNLTSSNFSNSLMVFSSLEFNIQFWVFPFLCAFRTICESPLVIILLIFRFIQIFSPSIASSYTILLETNPSGFTIFASQFLDSFLIIHLNPTFPGLPLEAPSKLSFFQPFSGGSHLHSFLAALLSFLYVRGGLIRCFQFFLISASHSEKEPSSFDVFLRLQFMTSTMLASILL